MRLEVIGGPHTGEAFQVMPGTLSTLGRAPSCSIALLRDVTVSRQHALLSEHGGRWQIEDCGSANGTSINGQRVTKRVLQPGDEITLGQSRLRVL